MKNSLKASFKKLRQEGLRDLFDSLDRGLKEFEIDFYLIGALARDFWMAAMSDFVIQRATRDVDIAVFVSNEEQYDAFKDYLIKHEDFSEDSSKSYRLYFKTKIILDLIPFGGIGSKERVIRIKDKELTDLNVLGLKKVYEFSQPVSFNSNTNFNYQVYPVSVS